MKSRIRALMQAGCERVARRLMQVADRPAKRDNYGLSRRWLDAAEAWLRLGYKLNPPVVISVEEVTAADHIMRDGEA